MSEVKDPDSSPTAQAVKTALKDGGIRPAPGMSIAMMTPTLGRITMLWRDNTNQIVWPMNTGRYPLTIHDRKGGKVAEMRNALVEQVLALERNSEAEFRHTFWLDDDVVPASPLVMQSLLQHDVPIAAGVYFCKGPFPQPLIFPGGSAGTSPFHPSPESIALTEVSTMESWGFSMGLSLVRTEVYKRMRDELDLGLDENGNTNWFKVPEFAVTEKGQVVTGGTEDFHFFTNCEKLGYRPLIDLTKHAFGFHIDMATLVGYPEMQFDQWSRRQPIVWPAKGERKEVVWK